MQQTSRPYRRRVAHDSGGAFARKLSLKKHTHRQCRPVSVLRSASKKADASGDHAGKTFIEGVFPLKRVIRKLVISFCTRTQEKIHRIVFFSNYLPPERNRSGVKTSASLSTGGNGNAFFVWGAGRGGGAEGFTATGAAGVTGATV